MNFAPYLFAFVGVRASSLRCEHGFACPRKAASHNSTMGGRRQLVFHHDQLCASRQKPIVPCRHWQRRARRDEIQPREIRLALPAVPADAGSSACDHRVSGANREWKGLSRTGKSSPPESMAWIGNAISSTTGCAINTNCKRKPATSCEPDSSKDCASVQRIGCGFIDPTTVRRRVGRAGPDMSGHAVLFAIQTTALTGVIALPSLRPALPHA
jgi:hypothetical protein